MLLDASEPISEQDQRVIGAVVEAGRALVIAFNKWDLVDDDRRQRLDKEIDRELLRVRWAPRVNVSATTGRGVDKLAPALRTALESWEQRVPTGRLNSWLGELVAATPPPVRGGKQPRVLFATQAGTRPPRFVLFTTGFLEPAYRRFVERRLREDFGFPGIADRGRGAGTGAAQVGAPRRSMLDPRETSVKVPSSSAGADGVAARDALRRRAAAAVGSRPHSRGCGSGRGAVW